MDFICSYNSEQQRKKSLSQFSEFRDETPAPLSEPEDPHRSPNASLLTETSYYLSDGIANACKTPPKRHRSLFDSPSPICTEQNLSPKNLSPSGGMYNLCLVDSPQTPKSLLRKRIATPGPKTIKDSYKQLSIIPPQNSKIAFKTTKTVNRNPFSPVLQPVIENECSSAGNVSGNDLRVTSCMKRAFANIESAEDSIIQPPKKPYISRDKTKPRYEDEFEEVGILG